MAEMSLSSSLHENLVKRLNTTYTLGPGQWRHRVCPLAANSVTMKPPVMSLTPPRHLIIHQLLWSRLNPSGVTDPPGDSTQR